MARAADKIRLMEIIDAVQDHFPEQSHCLLRPEACTSEEPCVLHESVAGWETQMTEKLKNTTLLEAAEGAVNRKEGASR